MFSLNANAATNDTPELSDSAYSTYLYNHGCYPIPEDARSLHSSSVSVSSSSPTLYQMNWPGVASSQVELADTSGATFIPPSVPSQSAPSLPPQHLTNASDHTTPATPSRSRRGASRTATRAEAIMTRHRAAALARSNVPNQTYGAGSVHDQQSAFELPGSTPYQFSSEATQSSLRHPNANRFSHVLSIPAGTTRSSSRPLLSLPVPLEARPTPNHHQWPSPPATTASSRSSFLSGRSDSPATSIASTGMTSMTSSGGYSFPPSHTSPNPYDEDDSNYHSALRRNSAKPKTKLSDMDRKAICMFAERNPKARQEDIASKFRIERSTVSKILKGKEKWLKVDTNSMEAKIIKHRPSKFPELEVELSGWVRTCVRDGVIITDAMIREKARAYAKQMGIADDKFKASSGWVENFKHRHSIRRGTQCIRKTSTVMSPTSPVEGIRSDVVPTHQGEERKRRDSIGSYESESHDEHHLEPEFSHSSGSFELQPAPPFPPSSTSSPCSPPVSAYHRTLAPSPEGFTATLFQSSPQDSSRALHPSGAFHMMTPPSNAHHHRRQSSASSTLSHSTTFTASPSTVASSLSPATPTSFSHSNSSATSPTTNLVSRTALMRSATMSCAPETVLSHGLGQRRMTFDHGMVPSHHMGSPHSHLTIDEDSASDVTLSHEHNTGGLGLQYPTDNAPTLAPPPISPHDAYAALDNVLRFASDPILGNTFTSSNDELKTLDMLRGRWNRALREKGASLGDNHGHDGLGEHH